MTPSDYLIGFDLEEPHIVCVEIGIDPLLMHRVLKVVPEYNQADPLPLTPKQAERVASLLCQSIDGTAYNFFLQAYID